METRVSLYQTTDNLIPICIKRFYQEVRNHPDYMIQKTNQLGCELQQYLISKKNNEMKTLDFAHALWSQFNLDNFYYVVDRIFKTGAGEVI